MLPMGFQSSQSRLVNAFRSNRNLIEGRRKIHMRNLALLALLLVTGCMRSAVRDSANDVTPANPKSEVQELEDRLGV